MSYSYQRNFRTRATAKKEIEAVPASSLPQPVKDLILMTIDSMQPDSDNTFVTVKAYGHCDHTIEVRQAFF